MFKSFPAGSSGNSLKWAIVLALLFDVPFASILLFGGRPESVMLMVSILPIAVSGLIVYSVYAAARMEYVLGEDDLRIRFPLSPLRISYGRIRGAGKVETSLGLRLFGGSLPGAHWGTFTTSNRGSVQAYATRYKGEFVLLELSDGAKILISPREPDAFVEALREKTTFAAPTLTDAGEPRLNRRLAAAQIAAVTIAWLALVAYVASIYPGLPEVIPVHFGFDGVPNRYGSKVEMLLLVALSALFPALNAVLILKGGKYNRGLTVFLGVVFLLAVGLFALVVNQIVSAI
ncbi:MAG: PH domain-containing protein [Candidatus Bathyarchaeota archaeon]|nr:PH domain-containing protein [Candidatus Bathyarchaeota archaeon]